MKDLWNKGKALWTGFSDLDAGTYASSIAYFTFLSLIPLLTLCISLVSVAGIGEADIAGFFVALVPDSFDDLVRTLVNDAFKQSGIAFSLSSITLLWSASKGVRALHTSLNVAYGVKETRSTFVVALISIVSVILLGILLAVTIYLVFGGALMNAVAEVVPGLEKQGNAMNVLNSIVAAAIGAVVLSACYTYLADGHRRFMAQLPGAALASLACGVLIIGFHVYVDNFCNAEALYGSIATVALFLFWMYLVSYIIIAGAFVNRALANHKK